MREVIVPNIIPITTADLKESVSVNAIKSGLRQKSPISQLPYGNSSLGSARGRRTAENITSRIWFVFMRGLLTIKRVESILNYQ